MLLVFVSNMLNHHQITLCTEFQKVFDEFYYVVTEKISGIGYQKSQNADFVLHFYEPEEKKHAEKYIDKADVVIFGGCPDYLIEKRAKENKLSFLYSERFFKKGIWRSLIPRTRKSVNNRIGKYKANEMYVLCASAYLPYDLSMVGFPSKKCYKWGYFPSRIVYEIDELVNKKNKNSILWAGRLLDWKHPEMAISVAERLIEDNIVFTMNIIGDGPLSSELYSRIKYKGLSDNVHMLGSMSPESVRYYMEEAEIFLATSDFYEGWGAVLNEAMNSACSVVASHAAGATPYLVNSGNNGHIFESKNIDSLYKMVKRVILDRQLMQKTQINAYNSIDREWNAEIAAINFRHLVDIIINGKENDINCGPCSSAGIVKNNWYKG